MNHEQSEMDGWALSFPDSLDIINTYNSVEIVALILLKYPLLLAQARSSVGWRDDKNEERQVLAIVESELAMQAINEILK